MPLLDITLREFLMFSLYALPGVLFWYFLFRYHNKKALKPYLVRDTFFIGLFSVIPLYLYQELYLNYFPSLGTEVLSQNLVLNSALIGLIKSIGAFFALGIFFVVIVGAFTSFYSLFTHQSLKNTTKALLSEPLHFSAAGLIFFFVLIIDLIIRSVSPYSIPSGLIAETFILAVLEEFSKHLIVRLFDDHKIKNIANAIEFSIIVGISFAFLENIIYFTHSAEASLQGIIIGRTLISMFGHIIFSAIFGYYYGLAKFAQPIEHLTTVEHYAPALPQLVYKIFRFKSAHVFRTQKIFEGLIFATLTHVLFNIFLAFGFLMGVIPILVGGGFAVFTMLNADIVQKQFNLVGTKEMPQEDFEKLTWKISVMKHLQDIKQKHPDIIET